MSGRSRTGDKKISLTLRPRSSSRSRRPARRRRTPTNNEVVFANPAKHHASTNFPLFSNNLVAKKPQVLQKAHVPQVPSKNKVLVSHQRPPTKVRVSPTPVEVPSRSINRHTRPERALSVKSEIIQVTGCGSHDVSPRSVCSTPDSGYTFHKSYDSDVFPFEYLPDDCKLKVFSLLPIHDKGRCARVCIRWRTLLMTSGVWSHIAFSDFPFWCITAEEHNCVGNCYIRYRVRVKQFMAYLKELRPILRSLEFKFDIGEKADGFLQPLESLIYESNTKDLRYACMNWKETPVRPFWTDIVRDVRCDEVMQKHRLRQGLFTSFFDMFTQKCPKVETLIIPFDWSDKSVECLLRLKNLQSLVLEKYFVFQKLCQDLMDRLLIGLQSLKQLMLEVWTPSGQNLVFFSLVSTTIEYLDISQSRGFYLNAVHLPNLKTFRVARHPWNGPLVPADRVNVPCIYQVLSEGAPNLEKINEHNLNKTWRDETYKTLEEVLKSVCSCRKHKSGWAM
ncbi:hypothetical protein ACF0H5_012817 [Mactra antiquata]